MMIKASIISVLICCGTAFAQTASAGHDHSTCGALQLNPAKVEVGGGLQFRYSWNTNTNNIGDENTNGFSTPLARIHVKGQLNDTIDYKIQGGFNSGTDDFQLLDAYAGINITDGSRIQLGQFHLPFLFEENIGSEMQMAAQTSVFTNIFGQGWSQGVQFECGNDTIRFRTAISDGLNTANTNFNDASESDFALTARLDYALAGRIDHFEMFSTDGTDSGLLLGVAGHYQDENNFASSLFSYTADVNWKVGNWSVYGAGVGRSVDEFTDSFNDFGLIAQTGYMISKFEPFVRYEMILPDTNRSFSSDTYNFATAGVNYYLYGQAAKFTVDAVYAFEATQDISSMNGLSENALVSTTEDGEISLVAQFQVLF